jgi:Domain of unknown function (DUF4345)
MSRNILVVVLYVLGVTAVVTGLLPVIGGPAALLGGAATVPSVDSQLRYADLIWFGAGIVLIWSARKPLERAMATRVVLLIAAVAGLGRLISLIVVGVPHPFYLVTMGLELIVTPLIILWHSRVFPGTPAITGAKAAPSN